MENNVINWKEVKAKTFFKANINDRPCTGRVQIQGEHIFLCQNESRGSQPYDMLGYKRGWTIGGVLNAKLASNFVTDLELSDEPFEGMIVPPMPIIIRLGDSSHAEIKADGIVVNDEETSYDKIVEIRGEIAKNVAYHNEQAKLLDIKYPKVNWDEIEVGTWFMAYIKTKFCIGKIQKEDGRVYFCQNEESSSEPEDKLGFNYAFIRYVGDIENQLDIKHLTFFDEEPKITIEDGKNHSFRRLNGYKARLNGGCLHVGCQAYTLEMADKVIAAMDKLKKDLVVE